MSGAIANTLPTCICRTLGRVGFALGAETFTQIYKSTISARPPISTTSVGLGANRKANPTHLRVFSASVSGGRIGRNDSVSVIIQRHNSAMMRP
jgi:hypothetical protein